MRVVGMGQAINQALREEMQRDSRVFLAGEGIGVGINDNPLMPTAGLLEAFGPARVRDTPVSEATRTGGFAGEVAAVVMEEAFSALKAPLRRVTGPDIPVPASPALEKFYIPAAGQVIAAIKELV